jgi:16S rRNA (guanine1207-N2)-methyltransferase
MSERDDTEQAASRGATCVYGAPPRALVEISTDALQVSPLVPGAGVLEALAPDSLARAVVAAPPGTVERRYVLARMLQALAPDAPLVVLAPKDKGGSRLGKELEALGCAVDEHGRKHQRICHTRRPQASVGLEAAIAAGAPHYSKTLDLWTQAGVFSWDRPDPGTQHLIAALPPLKGRGVDLGSGLGVLARAVLSANEAVSNLALVDLDRRAIEASRRNVEDPRATFHWADARTAPELSGLDFVVMNPPFHDHGLEDRDLGQAFIRRAHEVLRTGGVLWLVANRHLPYEAVLNTLFKRVTAHGENTGFKIFEARR